MVERGLEAVVAVAWDVDVGVHGQAGDGLALGGAVAWRAKRVGLRAERPWGSVKRINWSGGRASQSDRSSGVVRRGRGSAASAGIGRKVGGCSQGAGSVPVLRAWARRRWA